MAQINVTQFAKDLGIPPTLLIEQLQSAGIDKALAEDTPLTEKDKTQLLDYLRQVHGGREAKQKITLTRRQTSEIKKSDATGKSRTIQVEVRKKRVLVKREAVDTEPPVEAKHVIDAEQVALREEEARKQAELIALQSEEAQKKQEEERRKKVKETPVETPAEVEAAKPAEPEKAAGAVAAPTAAAPPVEGTLHKPAVKPAGKTEKKAAKKTAQGSRLERRFGQEAQHQGAR